MQSNKEPSTSESIAKIAKISLALGLGASGIFGLAQQTHSAEQDYSDSVLAQITSPAGSLFDPSKQPSLTGAARQSTMKAVIIDAVKSGSMDSALSRQGQKLSLADKDLLKGITSSDLRALRDIEGRLSEAGAFCEKSVGCIVF